MEWKQSEILYLKKNYHILGRAECSKRLSRTTDSVSSKIKDLGLQLKSSNRWLPHETEFLDNNYIKYGSVYCADKLNKAIKQVYSKASSMGLKTSVITRGENKNKKMVNFTKFKTDFNKNSVYILGLLWADGHIRPDKHLTTINAVKSDLLEVVPIFQRTGEWSVTTIKKSNKNIEMRPQLKISTTTWGLSDILVDYEFGNKSEMSPDKLLSKIPKSLKKYWFRGYLDGDGSIIVTKNSLGVVFASSYNQNWSFMGNLCSELGIKGVINRYTVTGGGYSHFSVRRKTDVRCLCDYIYSSYDGLGFSRKYEKYNEVLRYIDSKSELFWSDADVDYLINNYRILGGVVCATKLNRNPTSIYNKIRSLKSGGII